MYINIQRSNDDIKLPSRAHDSDSGWDLFTPYAFSLKANERITIPLWVKFEIKIPYFFKILKIFGISLSVEAMIRPKSGRSKSGIECSIGTIDQNFRGFVSCTLHNFTNKKINLKKHEKICQIVFMPVFAGKNFKLNETLKEISLKTERGANGFGSSGVK